MTCEELRDQLPAYSLGILDEQEARDVLVHLEDCREHDDELVELRATVLALALLDQEREPSEALVTRIDAIADAPEAASNRPGSLAASAAAPPVLLRGGRGGGARWWQLAALAAALATIALSFGGGWYLRGESPEATPVADATAFRWVLQGSGGATISFSAVPEATPVTVTMAELARLPEGLVYELWAIRDGAWVSIGTCNTSPQGRWRGTFDFALGASEQVAVTVEETAGEPTPTMPAILRGQF